MSFAATHVLARAGPGLARTSTRLSRLPLARPALVPSILVPSARVRGFAHTPVRPKKADKPSKKDKGGKTDKGGKGNKADKSSTAASASAAAAADEDDGAAHPHADPENPFDFADVESRWQRSDVHHEEKFRELRRALAGDGSLSSADLAAIGATPVVTADDSATTLGELALVIPRAGGRVMELRLHSAGSRKAITKAVQAHPQLFHGQQPQPDPDDELVLLLRTGTPHEGAAGVAEAAAAGTERARRVADLANSWRAALRRATARRQKTHSTWKRETTVRPDDLHRLDRDLLRGQDKHLARVDAAEKEALKLLDKGRR